LNFKTGSEESDGNNRVAAELAEARAAYHGLGLGRGLDIGLEMDPAPPLMFPLALRSLSVALGLDFDVGFCSIGLWD
jgi:hypothetical protein